MRRSLCPALLALAALLLLNGCRSTVDIRLHNASPYTFSDVRIGGQAFEDLAAGTTSDYATVPLRGRYATLSMTIRGHRLTGQVLHFGSDRFTYCIAVENLAAGHLAIDLIKDDRPC